MLRELVPNAPAVAMLVDPTAVQTKSEVRQVEAAAVKLGQEVRIFNVRSDADINAAFATMVDLFGWREFVVAGGLMSYGTSLRAARQVATYVGQILKGEKPADLPVQQATAFETVVNLKAANALGVTIPTAILLRADEVIE